MISQDHIDKFSKDLTDILNAEVKSGNAIVETSEGWPESKTIIIFLQKPFISSNYRLPSTIEFREINDPHYWKSEYYDRLTKHILACKYF